MLAQTTFHRVFQLLAQMAHVRFHGTHSAFREKSHTAVHTAKQGAFRTGVVSLPSDRSARFGNPAWPGGRAANFAVFGSWPGALPKNAESLRNSDAHKRIAVPQAFCVLREQLPTKAKKRQSSPFYPLATQGFRNVRNAPRVMIPPPIRNAPCFAVCALVCDLSLKAECVPVFTRESERGPFVREVERCDEKRFGTAL